MKVGYREHVADFLRARPNVWIPAIAFEAVGGRQGWRTRISQCRCELHMRIDNRVRRLESGEKRSEYKFVTAAADDGFRLSA